GAFHPPRAVLADTATLHTLPDRELRAGLADEAKYGAVLDAEVLAWLEAHAAALLARDSARLPRALADPRLQNAARAAGDAVRPRAARGPGRSGQVRGDLRCRVPRLARGPCRGAARTRQRCAGPGDRRVLPVQGRSCRA